MTLENTTRGGAGAMEVPESCRLFGVGGDGPTAYMSSVVNLAGVPFFNN